MGVCARGVCLDRGICASFRGRVFEFRMVDLDFRFWGRRDSSSLAQALATLRSHAVGGFTAVG